MGARRRRLDDLRLEQTIDRLRQGIVVRVADAADRWLDARTDQALCVPQSQVLRAAVRVMHQPAALDGTTLVQGLLQGIQNELA
ncbi:hypothetical protein VP06_24680 [Methylobacterium aquaticum]|jgi:hypothetical protein|uniref:Uncharacterized protein n=1 Tax=Methylobacterium aquaticum TaxID=270351 RepID=A0A0J6S2R2_9HYPH|nr:hypothetical protein VP06_24680 [Methylobacterium aquaticum]